MTTRAEARALYKQFRETEPGREKRVRLKLPKAAMVMGHVEFIGYATTRNGKTELYLHEFAPGSRPLLAAGRGKNELVLIGGRYHVTERGITDLSANGKEVDVPPHYKVTRR